MSSRSKVRNRLLRPAHADLFFIADTLRVEDTFYCQTGRLKRSVKESTEKTTSQIIAERIVRELKILLKHSAWNVSEIAYSLGFTETTHFNNFFKKHVEISPLKFRNI